MSAWVLDALERFSPLKFASALRLRLAVRDAGPVSVWCCGSGSCKAASCAGGSLSSGGLSAFLSRRPLMDAQAFTSVPSTEEWSSYTSGARLRRAAMAAVILRDMSVVSSRSWRCRDERVS